MAVKKTIEKVTLFMGLSNVLLKQWIHSKKQFQYVIVDLVIFHIKEKKTNLVSTINFLFEKMNFL